MEEFEINDPEIEKIFIKILFSSQWVDVRNKIVPYLHPEIFQDEKNKAIIKEIVDFNSKYNNFPKPSDMMLNIESESVKEVFRQIGQIPLKEYNRENLINKIQLFCRVRKTWNELFEAVELVKDNKIDELDPQKIAEAKAFSFDTSIGLQLFKDDGQTFFNRLHDEAVYIATGLKQFDQMMNGGFKKKTFNMFIAGTNVGKTLFKSAIAKQCLLQNYSVLFIPLEGTEEDIEDRMMFNLLDKTQEELRAMDKGALKELIKKVANIVKTKLFIKRYNQHSFNASKLRVLLKDLKVRENFIPDIVFIDYMGLTIPNTITKESGNQAAMLKRASEEFHGVAKDEDFALVSSMQFNREGFKSSNPNMDDISESFGTLFTADEVILLMQTEEMRKNNKYIYKKVKARSKNKDFVGNINVDFEKQKLFEPNSAHQSELERKKMAKVVESESSEVQEMMEKVEQFQTKKLIGAVDIT